MKIIPSNKILLALQFWNGDRDAALKLARLLADLEPKHCDIADFLLVARFDSSHDAATIKHVSRKFNVFSHVSKGRGTGWPHGCNDLLFGTLAWFYHKKVAGQIPGYKAIFTFEADGIPMRKDWIAALSAAWDATNREKSVVQAGAWLANGPDDKGTGHINGNCLLSGDPAFLKWLFQSAGGVNCRHGWDWILAPKFKAKGWADIPQIRSVWRSPVSEEIFQAGMKEKVIWYHGIKGEDGFKLCRKYLLP